MSERGLVVLLVSLLAAGVAFASPGSAASSANKLVASVRPCMLRMPVTSNVPIRSGVYVINVNDLSRTRYFSLSGRNIARHTTATYVGSAHWTVRLTRGTYAYRCGRKLVGSIRVT